MKTLALEVKKAVRKGKNIKETYTDMIKSTIRIAKAMKYPGAGSVNTEDILPSIKDIECNAWRKHLQGKTTMEPEDLVRDDKQEGPADEDLLITQNMLGKEATDAAAAAIEKLPKLLVNDIKKKICDLFNHIKKAQKHAAEATRTLCELHEDLPLDVFLRIADATVRPLVILHIPKTEALVQKLKEAGAEWMQCIIVLVFPKRHSAYSDTVNGTLYVFVFKKIKSCFILLMVPPVVSLLQATCNLTLTPPAVST